MKRLFKKKKLQYYFKITRVFCLFTLLFFLVFNHFTFLLQIGFSHFEKFTDFCKLIPLYLIMTYSEIIHYLIFLAVISFKVFIFTYVFKENITLYFKLVVEEDNFIKLFTNNYTEFNAKNTAG